MRADGRALPTDRAVTERDYSLRITNLRTTDSGRYICVALNAFGRSQLDAELTVLGMKVWDFLKLQFDMDTIAFYYDFSGAFIVFIFEFSNRQMLD